MPTAPDAAYFRGQARKCRMLAESADTQTARSLLQLAAEYETKAAELDQAAS